MKERMDLLLKFNQKFQKCRQNLEALHLVHGNSVERQKDKEEMKLLLKGKAICVLGLRFKLTLSKFVKGFS